LLAVALVVIAREIRMAVVAVERVVIDVQYRVNLPAVGIQPNQV
jgi:hypothetical protein